MSAPNTPTFLQPTASGQLSNKRGSNTGADALTVKVRYINVRQAGDPAGAIRVLAYRSAVGGFLESPELAWDSGWVANPPTSSAPSQIGTSGLVGVAYNGRIYAAPAGVTTSTPPPASTAIWSAPITGSSVGTWRQETPITINAATGGGMSSCAISNGRLYFCDSNSNIIYASILPDGSLSNWQTSPSKPANPGQLIGGNAGSLFAVPNQGWLTILGGQGNIGTVSAVTLVQNVGLNGDGSLQSWVNQGAVLPAARASMAVFYNPISGYVTVFGGNDGAGTVQSTVYNAPVTGLGVIGVWVLTDTAIPAAKNGAGLAFDFLTNTVYVIGGNNAGAVSSVYSQVLTATGATTGAWTTATALATATIQPVCAIGGIFTGTYRPISAGGTIATVQAFNGTSWVSGVQTLAVGSLGTGAAVTTNQDGSEDFTFNYNAFGTAATIAGFTDGDQVQFFVQFVDSQNGDASGIISSTIKIGQPPTLSAIAPTGATTNCQPTVIFSYTPGAGGGAEFKYQIQIKNNSGIVVADSGLVTGTANSFSPKLYAMLASGLAASTVITVYSIDTPVTGSSASATATTAFTPTQAAPSNPGTTSVSADNVGGSVIPVWTDPAGGVAPTFNRLYWRLTGATVWNAAKDLIVATQGTPQNFTLMDTIPLGQSVEIGVSSLAGTSPGTTESAIVSCGSVTISPDYHQDLGGYTAMLHVAGNGPSQRVPIPNLPPIRFNRKIDSEGLVMFGNVAPSFRYGAFNYREIIIAVVPLTSQVAILDSIFAAAQTGSTLVFRDMFGTIIYCGLPADRSRLEDLYYSDELKLIETQFTFAP